MKVSQFKQTTLTNAYETLIGTSGPDLINGNGGNDELYGTRRVNTLDHLNLDRPLPSKWGEIAWLQHKAGWLGMPGSRALPARRV